MFRIFESAIIGFRIRPAETAAASIIIHGMLKFYLLGLSLQKSYISLLGASAILNNCYRLGSYRNIYHNFRIMRPEIEI